jgi:hypothetical protein
MARGKATPKQDPAAHVELEVTPGRRGLWLESQSSRRIQYEVRYFALGTAGHQRSGFLRGSINASKARRFVDLGFDVIVAGITWQRLSFGSGATKTVTAPVPSAGEPSFSPMHPSLTSTASVQVAAGRRGRRRAGRVTDSYGVRRDSYGMYADAYGQTFDEYGLYLDQYGRAAEGYQDEYGAYLEGYTEFSPYEDTSGKGKRGVRPPQKRKAAPKKAKGKKRQKKALTSGSTAKRKSRSKSTLKTSKKKRKPQAKAKPKTAARSRATGKKKGRKSSAGRRRR